MDINIREIIDQLAAVTKDDYSLAFKLLGFIIYIAQEGNETLLSGSMISPRTYYRWFERVEKAGLKNLLMDAKLQQAISEYVGESLGGIPIEERQTKVSEIISQSLVVNQ
ncbi:MAG: hypothetical protein DWQ07_19940 [Chloroflexi bacterium]|nr:MAG: hypothetical protein DWQ07_19940 [Chloroflexota bacterium]MBL1194355.1 hypothetical protein [Chloroflexota bacterium]NOH11644.1 hypothetical protein [Chloroflexota bacterium]